MKLPRFWFHRPVLYWRGWHSFVPFWRGGDEWNRHTIVLGWDITGQIVIPYYQCSEDWEKCPWHPSSEKSRLLPANWEGSALPSMKDPGDRCQRPRGTAH